jgi:hypothetical protein
MSRTETLEPSQALDKFFAIVRDEAASNPVFAARLLNALDVNVMFRGKDAADAIDPLLIASKGLEEFRVTFLSFDDKTLKKLLSDHNLASKTDIGKRKGTALVDLLWERASTKYRQLYAR